MITEDYVSFETAKLLKEKGFNEKCRGGYHCGFDDNDNPIVMLEEWTAQPYNNNFVDEGFLCSAPTLQMAMKWLRLKHNICIDVHLSFAEDPEAFPAVYYVYILDAKSGNSLLEKAAYIGELNPLMDVNNHNVPIHFDSPEEACEVAIKYCLEHLI